MLRRQFAGLVVFKSMFITVCLCLCTNVHVCALVVPPAAGISFGDVHTWYSLPARYFQVYYIHIQTIRIHTRLHTIYTLNAYKAYKAYTHANIQSIRIQTFIRTKHKCVNTAYTQGIRIHTWHTHTHMHTYKTKTPVSRHICSQQQSQSLCFYIPWSRIHIRIQSVRPHQRKVQKLWPNHQKDEGACWRQHRGFPDIAVVVLLPCTCPVRERQATIQRHVQWRLVWIVSAAVPQRTQDEFKQDGGALWSLWYPLRLQLLHGCDEGIRARLSMTNVTYVACSASYMLKFKCPTLFSIM